MKSLGSTTQRAPRRFVVRIMRSRRNGVLDSRPFQLLPFRCVERRDAPFNRARHPDKSNHPEASQRFALIRQAYENLKGARAK
jgi:hypothetical protein